MQIERKLLVDDDDDNDDEGEERARVHQVVHSNFSWSSRETRAADADADAAAVFARTPPMATQHPPASSVQSSRGKR